MTKCCFVFLSKGPRLQQLRLRAAREVPPPLRARRPQHGLAGPVGDRGLQVAATLAQRRPVQTDFRNFHRIQRDRFENCQRTKIIT